VNEVAEGLGLKCVGWIFTDLIPEDVTAGTVKHLRGIHSYFLSAQECITAAYYQNLHTNVCKAALKGTFGSKFATVLVTGNYKR
jgi:nuclear protein localization family protein 4